MNAALQQALASIINAIMQHWQAVDAGGGVLLASAITNMPLAPPPGFRWIGQDNWTWGRDTLQAVIPVRLKPHPEQLPPAAPPLTPEIHHNESDKLSDAGESTAPQTI